MNLDSDHLLHIAALLATQKQHNCGIIGHINLTYRLFCISSDNTGCPEADALRPSSDGSGGRPPGHGVPDTWLVNIRKPCTLHLARL
jgi:hypothetical protein